jgi:hypothetical protein
MPNLLPNIKALLASGAAVVATTSVTGTTIDMSGFEGVAFFLQAGAITDGNLSVKAQGGLLANGSDAADLAGTLTTLTNAQDNNVAVLDLYRPTERYITPVIVRGGATGAVVQGLVAVLYGPHTKPTTQDATVAASKVVVSPAYGTA